MATATLSSKGQITIPLGVRNTLGLYRGDKLDFRISGKKEVIMAPVTIKTGQIYGILSHKCKEKSATNEEINTSLRKYFKRKFK